MSYHPIFQDRLDWYRVSKKRQNAASDVRVAGGFQSSASDPTTTFSDGRPREGVVIVGNPLIMRKNEKKSPEEQFVAYVDPALRVPRDGVVQEWEYVAHQKGAVEFQIWRPFSALSASVSEVRAELVGTHFAEVSPGRHREALPASAQIECQAGDVVGYTFDNRVGTQPLSYGQEEGGRITLSTPNRVAKGATGFAGGAAGGMLFFGPIGALLGGVAGYFAGARVGGAGENMSRAAATGWLSVPPSVGDCVTFSQKHKRVTSIAAHVQAGRSQDLGTMSPSGGSREGRGASTSGTAAPGGRIPRGEEE
eukprot:tig00021463_g21616.t1